MSVLAPFVHDARGRVYATADGPELYVYSGVDDSPLWKDFAEGILVGLAISGEQLIGVDSDGRMIRWRIFDGQRIDVVEHGLTCHDIAADPHGGLVLLTDGGVRLIAAHGGHLDVSLPGAVAVARDGSGGRVIVALQDGRLLWIDPMAGTVLGQVTVPAPAHDVVWSNQGCWVVGAADKLLVVNSDPVEEGAVLSMHAPGGPVEAVAVSADGLLVAARVGRQFVSVMTAQTGEVLATIEYKRPVGGVAFGVDTWLAIPLEYGDVNRLELGAGRLTRNGPGLGRSSDPWATDVKLEASRVRGALARARAGGGPVAVQVERPKPGMLDDGSGGRPKWLLPALIVGSFMLVCTCSSCCGLWAMYAR